MSRFEEDLKKVVLEILSARKRMSYDEFYSAVERRIFVFCSLDKVLDDCVEEGLIRILHRERYHKHWILMRVGDSDGKQN